MTKRGIAICHYNRLNRLENHIKFTKQSMPENCKLVVCDDGSDPEAYRIARDMDVPFLGGKNKGVGYNKNRALTALQDCFVNLI